jgi:hypothetical protein
MKSRNLEKKPDTSLAKPVELTDAELDWVSGGRFGASGTHGKGLGTGAPGGDTGLGASKNNAHGNF